jgi:single-stranded DNA-binding protein
MDRFRVAAGGNVTSSPVPQKRGAPVLVQGLLCTREYTDEKQLTRQNFEIIAEIIAQTILRIDYSKLAEAEQGDAAEPEA